MARLIEIQNTDELSPALTLQVGDVLWFHTSGGRIQNSDGRKSNGNASVEFLGAFVQSLIGINGQVLSPESPPNVVLFIARAPGQSTIEIFGGNHGNPFQQKQAIIFEVTVEF